MHDLGLVEAAGKICPPTQQLTWLGILFDSTDMTMSVPQDKLDEIMAALRDWKGKLTATRREVQSLLGSLNFVASVAPPTRLFTNRILNFLRGMHPFAPARLSAEARQDIKFFCDLLPSFNGMINKPDLPDQETLYLDSCLSGCGAIWGDTYYSRPYPEHVLANSHHITRLEMLNMVVAVKVWGSEWSGKIVRFYCDNMAACTVLQDGRSHDPFLQHCAREIFYLTSVWDIKLLVSHRPGVQMELADALSRMHLGPAYHQRLQKLGWFEGKTRVEVPDQLFMLITVI